MSVEPRNYMNEVKMMRMKIEGLGTEVTADVHICLSRKTNGKGHLLTHHASKSFKIPAIKTILHYASTMFRFPDVGCLLTRCCPLDLTTVGYSLGMEPDNPQYKPLGKGLR